MLPTTLISRGTKRKRSIEMRLQEFQQFKTLKELKINF
jgi:hypothetical protein